LAGEDLIGGNGFDALQGLEMGVGRIYFADLSPADGIAETGDNDWYPGLFQRRELQGWVSDRRSRRGRSRISSRILTREYETRQFRCFRAFR
jgi:hypothetical protein